jgi:hypothetical protein
MGTSERLKHPRRRLIARTIPSEVGVGVESQMNLLGSIANPAL